MKFSFDLISFFIGMIVSSLLWWILAILRPVFERFFEASKIKRLETKNSRTTAFEHAYNQALFKFTQSYHQTSQLFALDEIIEIQRFLAPPIIFEPSKPHIHQDITDLALPYLPDYPELAAYYDAPSLSLSQVFSGGVNIAIVGQPGTGKSTTLAYLASQLTKNNKDIDAFSGYTPILIHASELDLPIHNPKLPEDFLVPFVDKISQIMGVFDSRKIPGFVKNIFEQHQPLLLLDGVDELPQSVITEVTTYIRVLLNQYPATRVILTGSTEHLDGLLSLGFQPLTIMPWDASQQAHFLENWSELWQRNIAQESWAQRSDNGVDPILLNRWLSHDNFGLTNFEYMLKIWGAYAGDSISSKPHDIIEAHILRLLPQDVSYEATSMLGFQATANEAPIFEFRRATDWIKSFETHTSPDLTDQSEASIPTEKTNAEIVIRGDTFANNVKKEKPKSGNQAIAGANSGTLSKILNSGLLISLPKNKLRFSHPVFMGYLAGKGIGTHAINSTPLLNQPAWVGSTLCFRYWAVFGNTTELVNILLSRDDTLLKRPQLLAGRLLKDTKHLPGNPWRSLVIAELVQILQNEENALGLRGQAMVALTLSGEAGVGPLFRQLLQSTVDGLQLLTALGTGMLRDNKAVPYLSNLVEQGADTTRQAACLALVSIGSSEALESVAINLLRGDEQLRIYSAEALANNHTEGYEALREGISSEDILMRRAVVYGLARINDFWSTEILEKLQVNEEQWAVRNVAVEVLQFRQNSNPRIPKKLTLPHETPWLIEFAGKYGMGITPGQPATDVLLLATKETNREYLQPALQFLRTSPSEGLITKLLPSLFGADAQVKEQVYQAIYTMAMSGVILPDPRKFGLA